MAFFPDFIRIFTAIWIEDFWHCSHKIYRGPFFFQSEKRLGRSGETPQLPQPPISFISGLHVSWPLVKKINIPAVVQQIAFRKKKKKKLDLSFVNSCLFRIYVAKKSKLTTCAHTWVKPLLCDCHWLFETTWPVGTITVPMSPLRKQRTKSHTASGWQSWDRICV